MNPQLLRWNRLFAWTWIPMGFLAGVAMGLCFHREEWLGGYGSWKRHPFAIPVVSLLVVDAVTFPSRL